MSYHLEKLLSCPHIAKYFLQEKLHYFLLQLIPLIAKYFSNLIHYCFHTDLASPKLLYIIKIEYLTINDYIASLYICESQYCQ